MDEADRIPELDETAPAVSTYADYNGFNADDVLVTNLDDDAVGVTVTGVSPGSMDAGDSISVTIRGSGFAAGATVSLKPGNAPVVSNVVVVNSSTITVTLTYSGRAPKNPKVFDVRVTNPDSSTGVLADAFTVNGK